MVESKPSASPIDHVRRDSRDSAYHCPQCDTPFTRRSNLRRHFQIHMRSAVFKCQKCTDEFSSKEEIQSHSLTCFSPTDSLDWSGTREERSSHRMTMQHPYHTKSHSYPNHQSHLPSSPYHLPQSIATHGTYIPPPVVPSANFESAETHYTGHYAQSNYGQSLNSSPSGMPTSSGMPASFDGNFMPPSTPPSSYSHRRPSVSSSISSTSATSSPYHHALTHSSSPGVDCNCPNPPLSTLHEQVYDRHLEKMVNVVGDCLIETMGDVLTRPQGGMHEPPNGHLIRSIQDDTFRRTVMSEALPRVFHRMQGGDYPP
ncbi:hypothetical protein D9613_001158 [Agrocybe pediades]|uniref:C2H2-type domain-containing protein n=1 Tax=Agrocybe pediades TaxID=84607 RepID=A0A8H4VT33_9AGAR|nr:hypothetical protein D9613_001158 [Agrocybe pediades]